MIEITKGAINTVDLTLTEKSTLDSPFYLFVFTSDAKKTEVIFTADDISDQIQRYNRFNITETSGDNILTSGVITMDPVGFWTYDVYEQVLQSNLLVANTTSKVEEGKVKLIGDAPVTQKHTTGKTYSAYKRNS